MAYFLGLDAGGTKTECALAEDDTIVSRATGDTIKIMRISPEKASGNLDALLQRISTESGVRLDSIACTCVGLAGSTVPRIANWTSMALRSRVSGDVLLAGDEEIALDAAFPESPGVLVVAGTGSNVIGRTTAGKLIHVGGWGPTLADEGSGSWIGKQAVRAIFDAMDRGETTALLPAVLDTWGLADMGSLIDTANQLPGPDFAMLTQTVVECASKNDPYACRVLQQAGDALGMYATLAVRRVSAAETEPSEPAQIAFTGSILRHIAPVREAMCDSIRQSLPKATIRLEAVDPLLGALWRARQHLHTH